MEDPLEVYLVEVGNSLGGERGVLSRSLDTLLAMLLPFTVACVVREEVDRLIPFDGPGSGEPNMIDLGGASSSSELALAEEEMTWVILEVGVGVGDIRSLSPSTSSSSSSSSSGSPLDILRLGPGLSIGSSPASSRRSKVEGLSGSAAAAVRRGTDELAMEE